MPSDLVLLTLSSPVWTIGLLTGPKRGNFRLPTSWARPGRVRVGWGVSEARESLCDHLGDEVLKSLDCVNAICLGHLRKIVLFLTDDRVLSYS